MSANFPEDKMSETGRQYAANYRKPPVHTRFRKGQSGNPRGRPAKNLPALLAAARNEKVTVTENGKRRQVTKREAVIAQLVNNSASAELRATKMLIDMEQEYLAHGIAEDISTALSRYPSLFVIARNSSFTHKVRSVDVKQIGRELGVRYVLEGSLRKSGNRIRVTGQLVEAETSRHVWAERYDRELADIFAVQEEITEAVTTAVAPAIADAELQRATRKPRESLDA